MRDYDFLEFLVEKDFDRSFPRCYSFEPSAHTFVAGREARDAVKRQLHIPPAQPAAATSWRPEGYVAVGTAMALRNPVEFNGTCDSGIGLSGGPPHD